MHILSKEEKGIAVRISVMEFHHEPAMARRGEKEKKKRVSIFFTYDSESFFFDKLLSLQGKTGRDNYDNSLSISRVERLVAVARRVVPLSYPHYLPRIQLPQHVPLRNDP